MLALFGVAIAVSCLVVVPVWSSKESGAGKAKLIQGSTMAATRYFRHHTPGRFLDYWPNQTEFSVWPDPRNYLQSKHSDQESIVGLENFQEEDHDCSVGTPNQGAYIYGKRRIARVVVRPVHATAISTKVWKKRINTTKAKERLIEKSWHIVSGALVIIRIRTSTRRNHFSAWISTKGFQTSGFGSQCNIASGACGSTDRSRERAPKNFWKIRKIKEISDRVVKR